MADEQTKPVKAAGRATMAPAARDPLGDEQRMRDERRQRAAGMAGELEQLDDAMLDELDSAVRNLRRRRASAPRPPSFGLSEGERTDLEQRGEAGSPFTGERLRGDGKPGSEPQRAAPGEKFDDEK